MSKRKWTIWLSAGLLVILAVTGYVAIAAELGSKQDPLVTLSYIDVIAADTMKEIDSVFAAKKAELDGEIDQKLDALSDEIDNRVAQHKAALAAENISDEMIDAIADVVLAQMQAQGSGTATTPESSSTSGSSADWSVVTLNAGQTITGQVGCEIILRLGSAACVASGSPGLINLSNATNLAAGGELAVNNLYIVTIDGRGIKAGTAGCTIVISGSYTIG